MNRERSSQVIVHANFLEFQFSYEDSEFVDAFHLTVAKNSIGTYVFSQLQEGDHHMFATNQQLISILHSVVHDENFFRIRIRDEMSSLQVRFDVTVDEDTLNDLDDFFADIGGRSLMDVMIRQ